MNRRSNVSFIAWRFYLILGMIILAVAGLIGRVYSLAVLDQSFLRHQGDERVLRLISTPAFRGMIVDRNGFPLAVSTTVYSIWMNPRDFAPSPQELALLGGLLHIKAQDLMTIATRYQKKNREFVYLKRALSPDIANQIKQLNMPGIHLQQAYHRYYPEGEVAAHIVGFTNIDDHGQEGLELAYNQWLEGDPGKKWVIKDRLGRAISDVQVVSAQKPGHDLVLSIDRRIQYLAYRELLAGVTQSQALSGSAIVLDARTGEILAIVNQPSFNPNNRSAYTHNRFRNRAITDTFEPGSTIKPFSVAYALKSGRYQADSVIDTSPGWVRIGYKRFQDDDGKNHGLLTVAQILQISSNIGISKMILNLSPDPLWHLLHNVGFGEITGVGFPGEQSGSLIRHHPWGALTIATLAFGYGLSVTALQLTRAYSVIANEGIKLPVSLLRLDKPPVGEQVMDAKIAEKMRLLLESVVLKGTGKSAQVPGYRVGGKTGTAKVAEGGGYQQHRYTSSFVGMAPLGDPRLIVAVIIHDPQGKQYHGASVSGPVFAKIMEGTLRILDVPPDTRMN